MIAEANAIEIQEKMMHMYSKDSIVLGIYLKHKETQKDKDSEQQTENKDKEDDKKDNSTKKKAKTTAKKKETAKEYVKNSTKKSKTYSPSGTSKKVTTTKPKKANLSSSGTVSYGGRTYSISKRLTVHSTAYTGSASENGGYANCTSTGAIPKAGRTLAVDPRVIPYGTKVYIPSLGGVYVAEDCGGAIKGNKIDIFMNTYSQCASWGRRNIQVYILK